MAKQTSQTNVLNAITKNAAGAFARNKGKKGKRRGGGGWPVIDNAIAKVADILFGKTKKQVPYIAIQLVGVSPEEVEDRKDSVWYRFADTEWKTADEVMDNLMNDLDLLGVDTSEATDEKELPALLEQLKDGRYVSADCFEWEGNNGKGKSLVINGLAEYDGPDEVEVENDDPPFDAEDEAEVGEETDLDALGAAGDEGDEAAQSTLTELAGEAGIDPDSIPTWAELATSIQQQDVAPEEETSDIPAEGELYIWDGEECEIVSVDADAETVTVEWNGDAYENIPFADLSPVA